MRLKNKAEVSGRCTVLTTSFSHLVRRSCSRSRSALQPPHTKGERRRKKKKKKDFPEKHVTQISYTIVHGRKLTHTFVCTKQKLCGGPEIWLHSRRRSQIISKLKTRRKRKRAREPCYHEKHLFFGTSTAKSVCGIRVRKQKKKDIRTH